MKWIIRILVVLAFIAGAGYIFREQIILELAGMAARRKWNIGPHREVKWDRAPADQKRNADSRPNIVLILADDLGWNDLTIGGGGVADGSAPTPNIDAIGSEGIQFTNGYSGHSSCAPSRASLMSGRYPTRFGFEFTPTPGSMLKVISSIIEEQKGLPHSITHFDEHVDKVVPYEEMGMPTEEITLAETLKKGGYHTVHIGKWHLGRYNGMAAKDQGFDESLLMHSGMYLPEDDPNVVNSKQDFDPIDKFLWKGMQYAASFNSGDVFKPGGYLTDYYTDEAVKTIAANKNRPFFLYLAHWAPHTPLQATKADYDALSHIKNHRLRVYAAMIRSLDRGVGRVMEALKANGIDDNTLVIFTSDNGGAGYIGLPEINQPYRGWKLTFFEGGVHVPFFMRWPAKIKPGTTFDKPVHHFDIYSTAVGAAKTTMPTDRKMDGVDLLPFVPGIEGTTPGKPGQIPHQKLFWRGGNNHVVLADGWKLQRDSTAGKIWLFDMKADPTEQNNMVEQEPERVKTMLAMLDKHNAEQKEPAWPSLLEAVVRVDKTVDAPVEKGDEYIYCAN
ncbi:MAG: sulfatase-like hydrolase/transferase [Deltaproteobacteria bacterium]|jgi:arylsulfatase A-like enzyme|nr:sulfatase-like hydrolase/transferase [Deltaproteobacteria bacterium]MBT4640882.1 sulfatase-like hydrolase/transferase [Deltaproteobacteria bacterium]MBT6503173.1 sulfatase-like hydrolase/transferase [Deltaproteobacteria bacterium]MBT7155902.1 sulfatase-like hydrolase/transferase [Deltaproteobacteria bacterium]MBT7711692.1 sulfatase-like hydrolase/transferase [Deltaproteobacteria bacterium]